MNPRTNEIVKLAFDSITDTCKKNPGNFEQLVNQGFFDQVRDLVQLYFMTYDDPLASIFFNRVRDEKSFRTFILDVLQPRVFNGLQESSINRTIN